MTMNDKGPLTDVLADFAWRSWTELGVPGWPDRSLDWVIDPEALLLLTASLGPDHPRLWLNALDWTVDHVDDVALDRVRNLHRTWPESEHWGEFSGVLAAHTRDKWPDPGEPRPIDLPHTTRLLLDRPGATALRLRRALGVNAHTEVLRALLAYPEGRRLTVLEISEEIAYTKRTAASVVGRMLAAGLLVRHEGRYAMAVSLKNHSAMSQAFGPIPVTSASYLFAVRAYWQLATILDRASDATPSVRSVEARRALELARDDLARVGFEPPILSAGADALNEATNWVMTAADSLFLSRQVATA
jgi:hypothetical protein